jgi:hypothetical protein
MCKQALAFVVVVSAVVQALPARAAGTITGLTLSLPAIKTCVAETVAVNGTGQCATFSVNFGDGQKLLVLRPPANPIKFPATFHHTYSKLGTYKIEADGGSTCPGVASETVQVAAGPWITSMFTLGFFFSFDATPGALVILQGENFGNMPGQAWIHLERDGKPANYQLEVTPNDWGDTFVGGLSRVSPASSISRRLSPWSPNAAPPAIQCREASWPRGTWWISPMSAILLRQALIGTAGSSAPCRPDRPAATCARIRETKVGRGNADVVQSLEPAAAAVLATWPAIMRSAGALMVTRATTTSGSMMRCETAGFSSRPPPIGLHSSATAAK